MGREFIRHLEFYGFPDQNKYSNEFGCCANVDLSEIIKKNKEQDAEIAGLSDKKADKKKLDELSNTVDSIIETQSEINNNFSNSISGITDDIERLKEIDNEYGLQLSAITDALNSVIDDVEGFEEGVDELSGMVLSLSGETDEKLNEIEEELDDKLSKDEAEEEYAKKGDFYSKNEIDAILEEYATKEWIELKGLLTTDIADERYAKLEDLNALSGKVESDYDDLEEKIEAISGDVRNLSADTNSKIEGLKDNLDNFSGDVSNRLNNVESSVGNLETRVANNENNITTINNILPTKADKTEIDEINTKLDDKVGRAEYEANKRAVNNSINDLDDRKADKTEIEELNEEIGDVNDKIDTEIENREAAITNVTNNITNITNEITEIIEQGVDYGDRIQELEDGLAKEIADREQADIDLIGKETDDKDDDTIWAAKNYAKYQRNLAVEQSNEYTDQEVTGLRGDVYNRFDDIEAEISQFATKQYVDDTRNELKAELTEKIEDDVQAEANRAIGVENNLLTRIIANIAAIAKNDNAISLLANRVNAITEWDGTDPDEYVNTGNGVLDVLHREFHEYVEQGIGIESIEFDGENLVIKYMTTEGEKIVTIPVSDLVDLSNYYTKAETDGLLATKADLTDIVAERIRAEAEENSINIRIDNLVIDCGIYNN